MIINENGVNEYDANYLDFLNPINEYFPHLAIGVTFQKKNI